MKWAYGVTTVPERFDELLPRTLKSLADAGFSNPRLFVDGTFTIPAKHTQLRSYSCTFHYPKVRTFGNWVLALWELYLREPTTDRYAIFQDDFVTYKNLRQYLEQCSYPKHGYWNLYTFPVNEKRFRGWYLSDQRGLGAVGLVMSNEAVRTLLASQYMVDRPLDPNRGWKAIDGGIVSAFKENGWQEWVHNPSLVQHTGDTSSMGNGYQQKATSFKGEGYDALEMLEKPLPKVASGLNRIGLVGYNCATGLGELNRQIATYAEIDVWFIKPHPHYPTLPAHPGVEAMSCPTGRADRLERFLRAVDTVVFCEQPYYTDLIELAKKHKKRLVCVPMMEWLPPGARGWPQDIDLFVCPTLHCYEQFASTIPCVHFPWPVDSDRFKFKERRVCNSFLYIGGHGGWKGRKGIEVMQRVKRLWPEMPLSVRCQESNIKWPPGTKILPPTTGNADLYAEGDVLIVPHSVDGLGLEPMEAMSCGMPVVSTDGLPWNEIPSIAKIKSGSRRDKVRRPVTWYLPQAESIVEICKDLLGKDITADSLEARQWAESRAWTSLASRFDSLVRTGSASADKEVPVVKV